MSGSWSNAGSVQAISVIITAGTPDSGLFVYNGEPAAGDLVDSIAATSGTDPYGNNYDSGVTGYYPDGRTAWNASAGSPSAASAIISYSDDSAPRSIAALTNGQLLLGEGSVPKDLVTSVALGADASGVLTVQCNAGPGDDFGAMTMQATPVFLAALSPQFMQWSTLTYAADWAARDSAGSFPALQYRVDAEDNLVLKGVVHMTLAAGLPAGSYTLNSTALVAPYVPAENWRLPGGEHTSSANIWRGQVLVEVTTGGLIQVITSAAIAQGDNFYLSWDCPLGNLS